MALTYLADYQTFDSVQEMDENVKEFMKIYRNSLTSAQADVLFAIKGMALQYCGATHAKAKTIAVNAGVSERTVVRAVKALSEVGILKIINSVKLNGIKGANIYSIIPFLPEMSERVSERVSERDTSNEVNNTNCSSDVFSEGITSFNHLSLSLKQEKNNLYTFASAMAHKSEKKKEWMNEYQTLLFDFLHAMPLRDQIKDELHKLILSTPVNSVAEFNKAKRVVIELALKIQDGSLTVSESLRSLYKASYEKNDVSIQEEKETRDKRYVPVYDWLNNREVVFS